MKLAILSTVVSLTAALQVGEWKAPGAGDIRGPCPGLNTLANHGYLNRDGKNIKASEINNAMRNYLGLGQDLNVFQMIGSTVRGVQKLHGLGFDGRGLFLGVDSLQDLAVRDRKVNLEHDASLTRNDYFFNQDPNTKNATQIEGYLSFSSDGKVMTRSDLTQGRTWRIRDTVARNPERNFDPKLVKAFYREVSLLMMVLGNPEQTSIRVDYLRSFLVDEKLPFELGWKRREIHDLGDLKFHNGQTSEFEELQKNVLDPLNLN